MNVINCIDKCLLPKLAKNYDDCEYHEEYESRKSELRRKFDSLRNGLRIHANMRENMENAPKILAAVLILSKELSSQGPWHCDMLMQYAVKLDLECKLLYGVEPDDFLKTDEVVGNNAKQILYDECMKALHTRVTATNFKKYPCLVEVYCLLVKNIHEYRNIEVCVKTVPISLFLIDDYKYAHKKKGLSCCTHILKHLKPEPFEDGNYYEVIYATLKKAFTVKDIEVTRLVLECLQELYKVIPPDCDFKVYTSVELFNTSLGYIQSESNLYRKAALFRFMRFLIETNGINCVSKRTFQSAICYNLEVCCNKAVEDIMLLPVILCLEEWLKHCWCVWKFYSGHWVLTALFKLLHVCKADMVERIVKITATLITLCTKEERQSLLRSLQATKDGEIDEQFKTKLNMINKYIDVN